MNFTREPIIETVITPREGCKLVIRSSKGTGQEEYIVDAVEVVSFGHSFFFRSQERPKSFLVPVSDYEVLESKETRMVLKNVASDRAIKIGGGAPPRAVEPPRDETYTEARPAPDRPPQDRNDRKRGQRRRGRRGRDRHDYPQETREPNNTEPHEPPAEPESHNYEEPHNTAENFPQEGEQPPKAPSFISKLFPPPPTLIKESLSRYKPSEAPESEETFEPTSEPDSDDEEE